MTKRSPRGTAFERSIEKAWFPFWRAQGFTCIRNEPGQTVAGVYRRKAVPDYLIIGSREQGVVMFDTKECGAAKLYAAKIPKHQIRDLLNITQAGHRAYFLVMFKLSHRVVMIPPHLMYERTYVTVDDGAAWQPEQLFDTPKQRREVK